MPATSEKQKSLTCMALAIKEGKLARSYSKKAAEMADSMSKEDLEHYCKSPVKKG